MKTIYRYEVPVDDQPHTIELWGDPLAVGCRTVGEVEFWAFAVPGAATMARRFQVIGTGHPALNGARYWGTAVRGVFVWHLLELPAAPTPPQPATGATPTT